MLIELLLKRPLTPGVHRVRGVNFEIVRQVTMGQTRRSILRMGEENREFGDFEEFEGVGPISNPTEPVIVFRDSKAPATFETGGKFSSGAKFLNVTGHISPKA